MATAIVLAGAGARGAYEAGVLSIVVPKLLEEEEQVVLCGTSAGAINSALLAACANQPPAAIAKCLRDVWCTLEESQVFRLSWFSAVPYLLSAISAGRIPARTYGLLDTTPLRQTIDENPRVDWAVLRRNIGTTWARAAAVVATEVATGSTVVFTQGLDVSPPDNLSRDVRYRTVALDGRHVRASAAIPVAFPSVFIDGHGWFSDGGTRLNTPIAPAIDMLETLPSPIKRVLIVSTHPDPSLPAAPATPPYTNRPDIIDECASILHSMFVDRVAEDVGSLRRVNRALRGNAAAPERSKGGQPFRLIEHAYFGPPRSGLLGNAARDVFAANYSTFGLRDFSLISRALGGRGQSRDELLSFLFFDPDYLTRIFTMGQAHAAAQTVNGLPWSVTHPG